MKNVIFADRIIKKQPNFWNHILFHPTDAIEDEWGQKILDEVSKDKAAQYVRIYAMLEDIFSENDKGELVSDFTLSDQRIDYLLSRGFTPMIAYAGIPAFLAQDSGEQSSMSNGKTRYKGKMWITSPPKDYGVWEELCRIFTKHITDRYGKDEVAKWYLHCFNEPDGSGFFVHGDTDEAYQKRIVEYRKLYKGFVRGVTSVWEGLHIGGCAAAWPPFLESFLKYVTENKLRLDYVNYHVYGTDPMRAESGERPISLDSHFDQNDAFYNIAKKYLPPETEIVVDEWGACSHGFFKSAQYPVTLFRETEKFSAFFFMMIDRYIRGGYNIGKLMICLSGQHEMTSEFEGFRNFFSLNFIKKPIYNAYILAGKLHENLLEVSDCEDNITVIATKNSEDKLAIAVCYAAGDLRTDIEPKTRTITVAGVTPGKKRITLWTIDGENTNPYAVYLKKQYPEALSAAQLEELKAAGTLTPRTFDADTTDKLEISLRLLPNSVNLIEIED